MGTSGAWNSDFPECFDHCRQRAAATVNTERHRTVLVPGNSFDQRILCTGNPQVINERVMEAVERLPRVSDAQLRPVPTEPLRRRMAQLPLYGFKFREQAIGSGVPDNLCVLQQPQLD